MTEAKTRWTVMEMLTWTTDYLQQKGFDHPRRNVEWLLSHVLGYRRLDLYANFDRPLTPGEIAEFKNYLKRRLSHEPLQYIVGETEFYGYRFKVTPNVLIPRPDTEVLVERVLQYGSAGSKEPLRILDVGTGSGNIALSLAMELTKKNRAYEVVAIDKSAEAIAIARENGTRLAATAVTYRDGDIFEDDFVVQLSPPFDVLVSNPPYLSSREYAACPEEVRQFEPRMALDGGDDGLLFYRRLAVIAKRCMAEGGAVFLEVGYDQAAAVAAIFNDAGYVETQIANDYNGIPRVVHITIGR
jgi:release factor glutamine methyltransferase